MNFNKIKNFIQGKTGRNRKALKALKVIGFSMPNIRKALLELQEEEVRLKVLANGDVSRTTMYSVVNGSSANTRARQLIAEKLEIEVEDLFPAES